MNTLAGRYVGRFAPTPSGPLHFGSLLAALASSLEAHRQQGQWQLRIDDIDTPRVVAGASDDILRTLEHYGFQWDGQICFQSQRREVYREVLHQLEAGGHLFGCNCSRRMLRERSIAGLYDGHCRTRSLCLQQAHSIRFALPETLPALSDAIQGVQQAQGFAGEIADFVVHRGDGIFAYHLVCAVDDICQGITHIVRGSDLLSGTFLQRPVMAALESSVPHYAHIPVVVNPWGQKLSKQTAAAPIQTDKVVLQLWRALHFLGQNPPAQLSCASKAEVWQWAQEHWDLDRVPKVMALSEAAIAGDTPSCE
ncbi:tRNA glutamyl-Q(34) synthetase GluQRS [Desulfurispira natronophila]|uniref:Glutamyl-Q tRNA(Asp) synthetase n=1 Tax=Desulfurispira natronophila TaxID=682562 RepID=A0A7W8DH77_9BACT|nr:tRNA glutamyl-Q(34) synthetase GluQRS [Desulfurispira natronophila]MBB5022124.1 glutamyl-Q tRNA(Asp) synthetase [Desulfurispira natronophila]